MNEPGSIPRCAAISVEQNLPTGPRVVVELRKISDKVDIGNDKMDNKVDIENQVGAKHNTRASDVETIIEITLALQIRASWMTVLSTPPQNGSGVEAKIVHDMNARSHSPRAR